MFKHFALPSLPLFTSGVFFWFVAIICGKCSMVSKAFLWILRCPWQNFPFKFIFRYPFYCFYVNLGKTFMQHLSVAGFYLHTSRRLTGDWFCSTHQAASSSFCSTPKFSIDYFFNDADGPTLSSISSTENSYLNNTTYLDVCIFSKNSTIA